MGLPDYLSRAPVVNNDMSEDGEQDNHKLNPEYLQNLVGRFLGGRANGIEPRTPKQAAAQNPAA